MENDGRMSFPRQRDRRVKPIGRIQRSSNVLRRRCDSLPAAVRKRTLRLCRRRKKKKLLSSAFVGNNIIVVSTGILSSAPV